MVARKKLNPKAIQKSYMEKIEDSLQDLDVTFFDADNGSLDINTDYLQLPKEITDLPSRELGELLNSFTQQKMYYRTLQGRLELNVEEAKREYLSISKNEYADLAKSRMSEVAKDRIINQNEEVKPLYEKYTDEKNRLSILKYAIENIEDAVFMISREISRRNGDFNEENRSHNIR